MKKIIIAILISSLWSCSSNPKSFKREKERVEIELISIDSTKQTVLPAVFGTIVLPKVIEWSSGKLRSFIEKRSQEYVDMYAGSISGDQFYEKKEDKFEIKNDVIKITRYYGDKKASEIRLQFESNIDSTLLRLKPTSVKVCFSKARLKKSDENLDLQIAITIKGYWLNEKREMQNKIVGDIAIDLKDILLDKEYKIEQIENNTYLKYEDSPDNNKNIKSEWFPYIPVSVDNSGKYLEKSSGNYTIIAKITEIDDYGDRIKKFSNDIDLTNSLLIELSKHYSNDE